MAPQMPPVANEAASSEDANPSALADAPRQGCFMDAVLNEMRSFVRAVSDTPCPGATFLEMATCSNYWCTDEKDSAKRVAMMVLLTVFGALMPTSEKASKLAADLAAMTATDLFARIDAYAPQGLTIEHAMLGPYANLDSIILFVHKRMMSVLDVAARDKRTNMQCATSVEPIGIEKGRAEGKAEALVRLIEKRFGPLSDDVRDRIMSADAATIGQWLDRAIDAPDVKLVLDITH